MYSETMQTLIERPKAVQRCVACPGCNKVTSSGQCDNHCSKWFDLRLKEVSHYAEKVRIPNFA